MLEAQLLLQESFALHLARRHSVLTARNVAARAPDRAIVSAALALLATQSLRISLHIDVANGRALRREPMRHGRLLYRLHAGIGEVRNGQLLLLRFE